VKFDSISISPTLPGDKAKMKILLRLLVVGFVPATRKAEVLVSSKRYFGNDFCLPFKTTVMKRQNMTR